MFTVGLLICIAKVAGYLKYEREKLLEMWDKMITYPIPEYIYIDPLTVCSEGYSISAGENHGKGAIHAGL